MSSDKLISINFLVKDFNEMPLSNVQVAILDNQGYLINRLVLDETGKGELVFDCSDELIKFEISRVGFESLRLETNKNSEYEINAFLSHTNQSLAVEAHQDTLIIRNQTKNYLILEDNKGSNIKFSKINL